MRALPMSHGLGMMNAFLRSCNLRNIDPFSASVSMNFPPLSAFGCGEAECSFHTSDEISFLAQNEPLALRHGKVLLRLGVIPELRLVALIGGQAVEGDQSPRHVIRALVGKEISYKLAAATGNDPPPVFGVLSEVLFLKGINFVADDTSHVHSNPPEMKCAICCTTILRLSSKHECATARYGGIKDRRGYWRSGAKPHALFPL